MTQQTNWLPGILALALALAFGIAYLFLQRRKGGGAPSHEAPRDGVLDDLDRRAQSLIEQLKELAADKHSLSPEQYAAEKTRLEHEAAAALRARDEHLLRKADKGGGRSSKALAPAPAPTGLAARNPQLMGALWGGGIVLFFGLLGYLLVSEQRPRTEGTEATGRIPPGQSAEEQATSQEDRAFAEAQEHMRANPGDLDAAATVAHELIRRQRPEEAEQITNKTLASDPFHIESRVHRGVLRALRGDVSGAEQELVDLVDTYPDAQEALLFLGAMSVQTGNRAKALEYFERFTVEVPRHMQPPQLVAAIEQLRQEARKAP